MMSDQLIKIQIDEAGRLLLYPAKSSFEYIWRSATEVHWDPHLRALYSPKPREWSYLDWFKHIVSVVRDEYGYSLNIASDATWSNIPVELNPISKNGFDTYETPETIVYCNTLLCNNKEGGRETPALSGYRPHIKFPFDNMTLTGLRSLLLKR